MNSIDAENEKVNTNLMARCLARAALKKPTILASIRKAGEEYSFTIGLIPLHFVFLIKQSVNEDGALGFVLRRTSCDKSCMPGVHKDDAPL